MQIYGPAHLHGPQPIGPPHAARPVQPAPGTQPGQIRDELRISEAARLAAQAYEAADIRWDRIAAIRAELARGTYETPDKLEIALDRLLDEIRSAE